MTGPDPLLDIQVRFVAEQGYIQRFLHFLTTKGSLKDEQIRDVSRILHQHGLPELPMRDWRRAYEPYLAEEAVAVGVAIERIRPALEQSITEARARLDALDEPQGLHTVDVRSPVGEWIEYLLDALKGDVSPSAIQQAIDDARHQEAEVIRDLGKDAVEVVSAEDVQYAAESAVFLLANRALKELLWVQDRLAQLDLAHRLAAPETELNVLRQGFLLLMTAFDAAVFDLFRVGLSRDFFGRIAILGTKDRVSLSQFSRYSKFEEFRDEVIDDQLRSRYLKDLLHILEASGVTCVDDAAGDRFVGLIELVLRRNVHVHNRGIVDERYLERDDSGSPRYNIYNLQLGAVAVIDTPYWERANRLCLNCVERIAGWAGQ